MVTNLVSIGFYLTSATFARLSSRISFKVYFYLGKNLYDAKCNMKYSELWFLWDISMQETLLRLLLQIWYKPIASTRLRYGDLWNWYPSND